MLTPFSANLLRSRGGSGFFRCPKLASAPEVGHEAQAQHRQDGATLDDAEAYLVGWAREVDARGPFRIVVHLPAAEAEKARQRDLGYAMGHYFAYRTGMLERDLSDLFRVGWRSLAIGMAVLAVSIGLSQAVRTSLPDSGLARLLAEGIMIFGWVANWRPAEILLYDVWSARRRPDLYRRLADAQVELKPF